MTKQNALHHEVTIELDQNYQPGKLEISIAKIARQ